MKEFLRRLTVYLACSLGLAQLFFAQDLARCCGEFTKTQVQETQAEATGSLIPQGATVDKHCSMRFSQDDIVRYADLLGLIRTVAPSSEGTFPKDDRIAQQWRQLLREPALAGCDTVMVGLGDGTEETGKPPAAALYRLQDKTESLLVQPISGPGEPLPAQQSHLSLEPRLHWSGLLFLLFGLSLAWRLYAPSLGLRITPTAVPLLADGFAVGLGMLSGYGVTRAALTWGFASHIESRPHAAEFLSELFFIVGLPLIAASITYLAGQRVRVSRKGVLSLRFMRSDFLAWGELENISLAEKESYPRHFPAAQAGQKSTKLQLSGSAHQLVIIDEPQLTTTKQELKRRLATFAPEHWKQELERTLENW